MNKRMKEAMINGKNYSKEVLMKIGDYVASLWGGSCLGYEVNEKEQIFRIYGVEAGEQFFSDIDFGDFQSYLNSVEG